MEPQPKKKHSVVHNTFIALAILCVIFVAYALRGLIYNALYSLDLIPIPERYTELYFTNPAAIPTSITAGKPATFSFTVVNHEGVTTTYPYSSYFVDPSAERIILASGTISLADGASATIPVSYKFAAAPVTGEVVVDLPSLNDQSIDFLLPYTN
jgi:hypothetical protein